jgi:DNA-binding NarL/FixJ family response regulator
VGQALEQLRGHRPDAAAELARHFLASGHTERAARYSILAGDHAAALYAHAEAATKYELAVELLIDGDDQAQLAEVRCKLAAERTYIDPEDESIMTLYGHALRAFERLHDPTGQARAHHAMIRAMRLRGDDQTAALPHAEAALRLSPDEPTPDRVLLLLEAAGVEYVAGNYDVAAQRVARAMSIVERLDDPSLHARAVTQAAALQVWRSPHLALELLTRAEKLARQAVCWQDAGEWERSRSARKEMTAAAEHEHDALYVVLSWASVAFACIQLGAWEDGRAAVYRAAENDPGGHSWVQPWAAYRAWLEGQPEDALDELRTFTAQWRDRKNFLASVGGLSTLADWGLQVDRLAEALAAGSEGLELVLARNWHSTAEVGAPLAEALVLSGADDAEQRIAELEQLAAKYQKHVGDPQFLRARGILQQRRGELAPAAETLQRSAELARAQGAVIQLGRTLAVQADVAAAAGDERLASEALEELSQIVRGIGPEVGRLNWAASRTAAAAPPTRARYPDGLTAREVEVLRLISGGHSNADIAQQLVLSVRTVERHITNVYAKISARGRADATAYALRHNLE